MDNKELRLTMDEILKIRADDNFFQPADIKRVKKLNKYLDAQLTKAIPIIRAEAGAKWVSVLKKYKITVDSPESLSASVDILIEEARKQERERILQKVETEFRSDIILVEPSNDYRETCHRIDEKIRRWQTFKDDTDQILSIELPERVCPYKTIRDWPDCYEDCDYACTDDCLEGKLLKKEDTNEH